MLIDNDDDFDGGQEEEIPESLEKKWDSQVHTKRKCASCGSDVDGEALLCLFCGNSTGINTGVFGRLRAFLTQGWGGLLFLALLLVIGFFLVF